VKRKIYGGTTSLMLSIFVRDSSSTTGAGLASLVYNTSGLVGEYRRAGSSSWTSITLATATLGTFTSGGWIADGSLTGAYEVGVPNAAIASGVGVVYVRYYGATNMTPILIEIELDVVNYQDGVHFGLTALPNAAAAASGGLPTIGSGAGQITLASGNVSIAQSFPTNFASMAITSGGAVTVGTNSDKTGYSLTQAFPANFSALSITASTGYVSLAATPPTAAAIATQVWTTALPGSYTSGQAGYTLGVLTVPPTAASIAATLLGTALGTPTVQTGVTSGWTVQEAYLAALGTRYWPEETAGTGSTGTYTVKNVTGTALQIFTTDLDANGNPIRRRLS